MRKRGNSFKSRLRRLFIQTAGPVGFEHKEPNKKQARLFRRASTSIVRKSGRIRGKIILEGLVAEVCGPLCAKRLMQGLSEGQKNMILYAHNRYQDLLSMAHESDVCLVTISGPNIYINGRVISGKAYFLAHKKDAKEVKQNINVNDPLDIINYQLGNYIAQGKIKHIPDITFPVEIGTREYNDAFLKYGQITDVNVVGRLELVLEEGYCPDQLLEHLTFAQHPETWRHLLNYISG